MIDRRTFLGTALVGLTRKSGQTIEGGFVFESHETGHRLRDGHVVKVPRRTRRASVVIVGGGVAGLSAAWRLDRAGLADFVVLELESQAGGNARWGENEVSAFPWGAHYVPLPGASAGLVRELFEDLGVLDAGHWDERHLVHAPLERLYLHGRWQEGLEPAVGPTARDRTQFARFADLVAELRASKRFTIPMAAAVTGTTDSDEDHLSMAAWLDARGLDSPWLRWMVDYACRDDYGARAADVSAWAGLLYFAGRDDEAEGPLTWPEGNGWIVRRLLARFGARVRPSQMVWRVERHASRWRVLTEATAWEADVVILAVPLFIASRLVDDVPRPALTYSPWFTTNLTLDRWPRERGFPVAWDNVIFESPSLGYVVATHQHLRRHVPRTVWTHYWALADQPPVEARRWLLGQSWATLRDMVLADLRRAHPDIDQCVRRVDILRLGHAMVRPTPGLRHNAAWRALQDGTDGLYHAHSDLSGLPLFEEAQYRGVLAADRALARLSGTRR